jgi:hypothetical protein
MWSAISCTETYYLKADKAVLNSASFYLLSRPAFDSAAQPDLISRGSGVLAVGHQQVRTL